MRELSDKSSFEPPSNSGWEALAAMKNEDSETKAPLQFFQFIHPGSQPRLPSIHVIPKDYGFSVTTRTLVEQAQELYMRAAVQFLVSDCWDANALPDETAITWIGVILIFPNSQPDGTHHQMNIPDVLVYLPPGQPITVPPLGPNNAFLHEAIRLDQEGVATLEPAWHPNVPLIRPGHWYKTLDAAPKEAAPDEYDLTVEDVIKQSKALDISLTKRTLNRWTATGLLPAARNNEDGIRRGWHRYPSDTATRVKAIGDMVRYGGRTPNEIAAKLHRAWPFQPGTSQEPDTKYGVGQFSTPGTPD